MPVVHYNSGVFSAWIDGVLTTIVVGGSSAPISGLNSPLAIDGLDGDDNFFPITGPKGTQGIQGIQGITGPNILLSPLAIDGENGEDFFPIGATGPSPSDLKTALAGKAPFYWSSLSRNDTGAVNNWNPGLISGNDGSAVIEWNGTSDVAFTGMLVDGSAGYAGFRILIKNTGTKIATFAHESASSTAANRFTNYLTSTPTPIAPGGWILYYYSAYSSRWLLIGHEQGAWIPYTPVWGNTVSPNTVGNAVLTGTYCLVGTSVNFRLQFTFGSTSVAGSGGFTFTLPINASLVGPIPVIGSAIILDASAGYYGANGLVFSANTFLFLNTNALSNGVNGSNPMTWVATDGLQCAGMYEAT